mgnify:CR=1 FL=1
MTIDFSKYWFRIKTVKFASEDKDAGLVRLSNYFNLRYKQIKSYESYLLKDEYYTLVSFDDDTDIIADKPIKRFKAEIIPSYNELLNEYLKETKDLDD